MQTPDDLMSYWLSSKLSLVSLPIIKTRLIGFYQQLLLKNVFDGPNEFFGEYNIIKNESSIFKSEGLQIPQRKTFYYDFVLQWHTHPTMSIIDSYNYIKTLNDFKVSDNSPTKDDLNKFIGFPSNIDIKSLLEITFTNNMTFRDLIFCKQGICVYETLSTIFDKENSKVGLKEEIEKIGDIFGAICLYALANSNSKNIVDIYLNCLYESNIDFIKISFILLDRVLVYEPYSHNVEEEVNNISTTVKDQA